MSSRILPSRTFTSLHRHRNYHLYFVGQFVSQAGTWLQGAAQSWLVLQLTHSAASVGIVTFWQFGPYAVVGLFGGPIADRMDTRKLLIWTQVGLMLAAALLAVISMTHMATVYEIDAIAAGRGLIMVLYNPSRQTFIVQMVGRDELPNAIALNSSVANATRILGPGIGGILIATLGVGPCFLINAVSFLAVIFALLMMRPDELFPLQRSTRKVGLISSLSEGISFAWRTPQVLLSLAMLAIISTMSINFNVLLPVLARQTLHSGSEVFGFLTAAFGLGALIGALASASLGQATWPIILGAALGFGVMLTLIAPQSTVWACLLLLLVGGVFYTLYTSNSNAVVQLSAPGALQGRVSALYSYIFTASNPLGALIAGGLAAAYGTGSAFTVAGLAAVLTALVGTAIVRTRFGPVPGQGLEAESEVLAADD